MATNPSTGSRLADYFFVAGLNDDRILSTYTAIKEGHHCSDYFEQQQIASAQTNNEQRTTTATEAKLPATNGKPTRTNRRSTHVARDASFGVFDHVQAVIDNFDKERDSARDSVIAVHDQRGLAEKFKMAAAKSPTSPILTERNRSASTSDCLPASPATTAHRRRQYSEPPPLWLKATTEEIKLPANTSVPNILDIKYVPTVLMRYPKEDHVHGQTFPPYTAMASRQETLETKDILYPNGFCFPKDITLYYGKTPPPEHLHSFVMTDENGATVNGTCVVFYERLDEKLIAPINQAIEEWVQENMSTSSIEYAQHLEAKIKEEESKLTEYGTELAALTTLSTTAEIQKRREMLEELLQSAQENVALYSELLDPVKMATCNAKYIWVPKSIGLLGAMPWNDLYGDWLRILTDAVVGVRGHRNKGPPIKIESAIYNIIREVPLPPPGRFEIALTINRRPLFFSRPPMNQVPLLKNFSLFPIFRALSPHLILTIVETLLSEGKVLFLSQFPGMLSLACETFRYLLFPFYWQFVFIPVIPQKLLTCLQAPIPYIIGYTGTMDEVDEYVSEDTCIVNLDSNTIHQLKQPLAIPDKQRRKLYSALEQYAPLHGARYRIPYGVPLSVRELFPNSRMLLSCGRSKVQSSYDAPSISRNSDASEFSHSIWSNTGSVASNNTGRRLSGFWSSNNSTKSSNDSSTSLPASVDTTHPQYPGTVKLAILPQASTSSSSLHTPPTSPTVSKTRAHQRSPRSVQRHGSTHSQPRSSDVRRPEHPSSKSVALPPRPSTPTSIASAPEGGAGNNKNKRRLSTLMSKPRASFQHQQDVDLPPVNDNGSLPRVNLYSAPGQSKGYDFNIDSKYQSNQHPVEVARRTKHIEGHIMTEVLPRELASLQGYRCLCGEHVIGGSNHHARHQVFMRCQGKLSRTKFKRRLTVLHACLPACFNERKVQEAFLRMFASLLCNYRVGCVDDTEELSAPALASTGDYARKMQRGMLYFSKEKFLKHAEKERRAYLSQLSGSQMFTHFITDRLSKPKEDPEVLLFDEFIKLKLNRSRLKLVKDDTPFLNDSSFQISQTIWATPPDDRPGKQQYKRFPIDLDIPK
ncbi:AEX-3 domain-containing protein [Dichotomocladium elegans]|nr:AEX-3 domain-containing protein [Dichotomocladium elegans]